jgi:hypothetical protein
MPFSSWTMIMGQPESHDKLQEYERRAPGWDIRCLRCGYTEPWGKYGIRLLAAGRKWTAGRCARCHRFCCHVIEKRK